MSSKNWPKDRLLRELKRALNASPHEHAETMLREVEKRLCPDGFRLEKPTNEVIDLVTGTVTPLPPGQRAPLMLVKPRGYPLLLCDNSSDMETGESCSHPDIVVVNDPDDPGIAGWFWCEARNNYSRYREHYISADSNSYSVCGHAGYSPPVHEFARGLGPHDPRVLPRCKLCATWLTRRAESKADPSPPDSAAERCRRCGGMRDEHVPDWINIEGDPEALHYAHNHHFDPPHS